MILDLLNAIARKQGIEHCTLPLITLAAWLDMETLERHTRAAYSVGHTPRPTGHRNTQCQQWMT